MEDLFKMNLQLFADEGDNDASTDIDFDDEAILPDDLDLSELNDEPPAEPQAEEKKEEGQSAQDTKPEAEKQQEVRKIKVKFNHQEMEIPEEEAIPLIQKGLNYDKIYERYQALQNDPRLGKYDRIQQLSKLFGFQSEDQLIDALYQQYYQIAADQRGLTPEQVRKEHELNQERERLLKEQEAIRQQRERNAMYERFLQVFPDVKPQDIKPETWERVRQGMDLTLAYTLQLNEELQRQLQLLKQKEKNKSQAPVTGTTKYGATGTEKSDPFLEGFDSEF